MRCVFDVLSESGDGQYRIMMYLNFKDYAGLDAVTNIRPANQNSPMEKASVPILASCLDSDTKWGLC